MIDYLIIGSGLFGSTFAYKAKNAGKKVLVIDKRSHTGGNIYCESIEGIQVHKYGPHIFHTNNKQVWNFVNQFVSFNNYIHSPMAFYNNKLYNLPFNMNTFYQMWGITNPIEAKNKILNQINKTNINNPKNLEEQAISLVGKEIYDNLIKCYTEKQWGKKCDELPAFIINRLPVRFTFNNNYFNDTYQGIPIGGYNKLIDKLLDGIEVKLNINFFDDRKRWESISKKIVYTGKIDEYYDYCFGKLDYRSIRFETEIMNYDNFQGNSVINYPDINIPYTRIIEHKHFEFGNQSKTIITKEYPVEHTHENEPLYPINDDKNMVIYNKYYELTQRE